MSAKKTVVPDRPKHNTLILSQLYPRSTLGEEGQNEYAFHSTFRQRSTSELSEIQVVLVVLVVDF